MIKGRIFAGLSALYAAMLAAAFTVSVAPVQAAEPVDEEALFKEGMQALEERSTENSDGGLPIYPFDAASFAPRTS